jgi:predicted phosphodiesterase
MSMPKVVMAKKVTTIAKAIITIHGNCDTYNTYRMHNHVRVSFWRFNLMPHKETYLMAR